MVVVFPALKADPPEANDQSMAGAANPVDVADDRILCVRWLHDSHGGFAAGRNHEHVVVDGAIFPLISIGRFLLNLILAADVGSNRDVGAGTGNVGASVGGIICGRVVLTGIVIAVVVRSSVCGEIRHASGRGSIGIVVSSSAIVEVRRHVGIGVPMAGKTIVKVAWVSAAREAGKACYTYDIPFAVCGALWSWYFMVFPPPREVISWS